MAISYKDYIKKYGSAIEEEQKQERVNNQNSQISLPVARTNNTLSKIVNYVKTTSAIPMVLTNPISAITNIISNKAQRDVTNIVNDTKRSIEEAKASGKNPNIGDTLKYLGGKAVAGAVSVPEGIADLGASALKGVGKVTTWASNNPLGKAIWGDSAGKLEDNIFYQLGDQLVQDEISKDISKSVSDKLQDKSYVNDNSLLTSVAEGVGQVGGLIATGNFMGAVDLLPTGTKSNIFNTIATHLNQPTSQAMFLSVAGNGYTEALKDGASETDAVIYGLLEGAKETGTEIMYGGLGSAFGKGALDDVVKNAITSKIKNGLVKKAAELGISMAAEGLEETVATLLEPFVKYVYTHKLNFNEYDGLLNDFLGGALVSGLLEGGQITVDRMLNPNDNSADGKQTVTNNAKQETQQVAPVNTQESTNVTLETLEQEASNIEPVIKELESQREKTIQKAEQKRLDNQIKSLQEQLDNIQKQIEQNTENTQNNVEQQVPKTELQTSKIDLPGIDNNINKVSLPGIENNINIEPVNNGSFINQDTLYRGSHQIENAKPLIDLNIKDIENKVTELNGYLTNQDQSDLRKLNKIFNNPNEDIKIYRAAPVNELNSGDWVTTDKSYAKEVANNNGGKVYEYTIKPGQLYYPDNIRELPSLHRLSSFQYIENTQPVLPVANSIKQDIKLPYIEKNQSINNKKDGNQKATNIKSLSTVPFNKESINNLKMKHIDIINTKQELIDRIKNVLNNRTEQKNFTIGALSENTKARIEQDVQQDLFKNNQYSLIMNDEYIRHIEKHFKTVEEIADEVINLFDMVNNYDTVELEIELKGTKRKLIFEKSYPHADIRTIEVVSNNNNSLNLTSVYYTKKNRNQINQRITSTKGSNGMLDLIPASTDNNTINLPKSQIAPLPNNSNMQNNEKDVMLPSARVQNEINEMEGLKAANDAFGLSEEETKRLDSLRKKYDKEYITEKKFKTAEKKILSQITNEANSNLGLTAKESKEFKEKLKKLTNNTKEELTNELAKNDVRKIISDYSERTIKHSNTDIEEIKRKIRNKNIKVSDYLKNQITDYGDFKKRNFGKLRLTNDGIAVDSFYEELKNEYPSYFSSDVMNDADILETLADFMNKDTSYEETLKLPDEEINDITDKVYKKLINNALSLDEIDNIDKEIYDRIKKKTRKDVQEQLLHEMNITTDDLQVGKDISSLDFQRTDPIRVNEKVFGYEIGKKINDATINKTKHNEAERNRFLNKERQEIKDLGIKARSKESAAVQKYGEKQYVDDKGTIREYGDYELAQEFPNVETQNKIKKAARELRKKYDNYIDQINNVITNMGYDAIPKRPDYMRHFQELDDKLSQWGIPLNPNDLNSDSLPTDINGITDQFRPGKNWFASAMPREGLKTTYDAITGIDGYLEGASNLIYHTEDIQRYRSLSKVIRETYGQIHGLDNIDKMSSDDAQQRITDVFNNKLSKYVAWLDEQANALAGKKGAIDRGAERALGRRIYKILDAAKKQVGSNMTGFNVRSALTNFASAVQGASKTNKIAFIKGTISSLNNIIHDDGLIDKSDFLTSRLRNGDMISKKLWQKASNAGQILMAGSDYFTANQIWRSKYYENLQNGMDETEAIKNADDFAARIMGDRSKGSTAEIFNSKTLGLLTQFQLEVNNQWSSIIHDNKMDIQSGNKSGATVLFQLGQLAAMSYFFNNFMKSITGSSVMIDPIDMLKKILGDDDDEDKTIEERTKEVLGDLVDNLPFVSFLTGGRIPISEAFTGLNTAFNFATGKTDNYGNEITSEDVKNDVISSAFYWLLPTGYGQLKKSIKGLNMYDTSLPIAGSYTDSGNLRFTADTTAPGIIKAALFGQYSSKEAQKYIDSGYSYINKSKIDELKELNMTASQYRKYRTNLNNSGTTNAEKIEFISNSNYSNEQKNIMARDVLNESEEKYAVATQISPSYYKYAMWKSEIQNIKNNTTNDKQETIDYINNLELSIPQKAMFIKMHYKTFKQYDTEIVNYINEQNLTIDEKAEILTSLGFTIRDGRVYS